MAIDNRVYKCMCGSTEYDVDSNGVATCRHCGIQFVPEDGCSKIKILPGIDRKQFIRDAWIYLSREDAPLDVFDCDFGQIGAIEYQVMMDFIEVRIPYQATVGYDRQEPYLTTETYYEREPYITTERVYDSTLKTHVNRQVTKYRNVQKERQVTKYRTVTDWSPFSAEHSTKSAVYTENGRGVYSTTYANYVSDDIPDEGVTLPGSQAVGKDSSVVTFDMDIFMECMGDMDGDLLAAPDDGERDRMRIVSSTESDVTKQHNAYVESSLVSSIRGDHFRDLDYHIEINERYTLLFLVPEFYATLSYKGEDYKIKVFPFGKISPHGDTIDNSDGLKAFEDEKYDELAVKKKELGNFYSEKKWQKNKGLLIFATVMLTLSILGSVLLSVLISSRVVALSVVLVLFVAGVIGFILSRVVVNKNEDKINSEERAAIGKEESRIHSEVASFTTDYNMRQLDLLNMKLESLGLEPASLDDIS